MEHRADVGVIGGGCGGALMAMVARQMGHSVVIIERGTHPRFAIGESSTPLTNLYLQRIFLLEMQIFMMEKEMNLMKQIF